MLTGQQTSPCTSATAPRKAAGGQLRAQWPAARVLLGGRQEADALPAILFRHSCRLAHRVCTLRAQLSQMSQRATFILECTVQEKGARLAGCS